MSVQTLGAPLGPPLPGEPSPDTPVPRSNGRRRYPGASIPRPGPLDKLRPDPLGLLTDVYQQNQAAIGNQTTLAIRGLWDQHIDPERFSASWRDIGPVMKVIIAQRHAASAADAADYYRNLHAMMGLKLSVVRDAPFSGDHLNRMAGAVANGQFYHQLNTQGAEPGRASEIARNLLSGAGARFALQGGRNTVMAAVSRDPDATGWERLMTPNACSYCSMQAAKGVRKPGNTRFRAHDYCHCLAAPVLRGRPETNERLSNEWKQATGKLTGDEARAAWDDYWNRRRDAPDTTH
jgi:hypothetical protein